MALSPQSLNAGVLVGAVAIGVLGARVLSPNLSVPARGSYRLALGSLMLGWSYYTAHRIDAGLHAGWSLEWRALLVLAMMLCLPWGLCMIGAGAYGVFARTVSQTSDNTEERDPYFLAWLGPATLAILALALSGYLQDRIPTSQLRATLLAVGGLLLAIATVWPRWFAEHFVVDELLHRLPHWARRAVLGAAGFSALIIGAA